MYPCDMDVNGTIDSYKVEPCSCNYWEAACKLSNTKSYPLFFDGFDFVVVFIVYVGLSILSLIIYFIKRKVGDNDVDDEDQTYDSEDMHKGRVNGSYEASKEGLLSGTSNNKV